MKQVTVIIATCNRPLLLRNALDSIAAQTARNRIHKVVVSENSGNMESKAICDGFSKLPLEYAMRRPPVNPLEHGCELVFRTPDDSYTAILHDDDWWTPKHLETALRVLDSNQGCAAAFSNFFETRGHEYPAQVSDKIWKVWVSAGCNFHQPNMDLDAASVLSACLLGAAFHYSTLVGRSEIMREAFKELLLTNNQFDSDRTIPVFLSHGGSIAYNVEPSVFVRFHPDQDSMRDIYVQNWGQLYSNTTLWMMEKWPERVQNAVALFNSSISHLDTGLQWKISDVIGEPHKSTLINKCGMNLFQNVPPSRRNFKWLFKQLCPPVLLAAKHRFISLRKKSA